MLLKHPETLGHTLSDGDARHHDNELAPAVTLVQLEHRLDIDISLASPGLHLNVKPDPSEAVRKRLRQRNIIGFLNIPDARKYILVREFDVSVTEADIVVIISDLPSVLLT